MGIIAAEGEFTKNASNEEKLLAVQTDTAGGKRVLAAMNSYQALLRIMATPQPILDAMASDGKLPPGVTYDKARAYSSTCRRRCLSIMTMKLRCTVTRSG